MYKQMVVAGRGVCDNMVQRVSDGAVIPFNPDNTDAQAFAKWLKDGGTPESAEDGGSVTAEWVAETIAKLLPNG